MVSTLRRLSEPSTACLMCSGWLFRPAAPGPIIAATQVETKLGGDHHLAAKRSEGFAHKLFVRKRAVHFGGVKECDAAVHCRMEKIGHLLLIFGRAVAKAHSHAAQARVLKLPGCCFQVCASAWFLLRLGVTYPC